MCKGEWQEAGATESAKVQIGAKLLCKSAKMIEAALKGGAEGDRMVSLGIHFKVTGDGHGHREFRSRPFGHRELAPGFRRLKAERLAPERLTTVAVTRHLKEFN